MYTHLFIIILDTTKCFCYAGYDLFQGFNVADVNDTTDKSPDNFIYSIFDSESEASQKTLQDQQNLQNATRLQHDNIMNTMHVTPTIDSKSKIDVFIVEDSSDIYKDTLESSLKTTKLNCPEDERPSNIGPYEVPTQRDLVLFTRNIVLDMFNSYNREAFFLLKDIRAATKATSSIEKNCKGNIIGYKKCVKLVSRQCQQITKKLVESLENQKQQISNLTKVKICNLSEMTLDPIEILKLLAQEKISLEFALPGFLRLLSECTLHCIPSASSSNYKPIRHMTDQDLIIKHFLTRKSYLELITDSRHKSKTYLN